MKIYFDDNVMLLDFADLNNDIEEARTFQYAFIAYVSSNDQKGSTASKQ